MELSTMPTIESRMSAVESRMSAVESFTGKPELLSTRTENDTDLHSYWMYAGMILTFVFVCLFCLVIFLLTITAPDVQESTLFDEKLKLSGGDYEDHDVETTTEKSRELGTSARLPRKETVATRGTRSTPAVASTRPAFFTTPTPISTTPSTTPSTPSTTPSKPTTTPSTPSTTPTTSSRAPTTPSMKTTTTPVPVALAAPIGTVVCTVSNLMPPQASALPPDGTCDLLFFESFYKDDKNKLAGGYGGLELNARIFLEHALKANKTQYGASFAVRQMTWNEDFMSENFYEAIEDIWNWKIYHFGFLNLYRDFTTPEVVTKALLALKELYFHVKRINQEQQPSYQILGLSIDLEVNFTTVNLMRSVFVPSMFISIGHISYSDASFTYCRILPPTIRSYRDTAGSNGNMNYGHSMYTSVQLLDYVRRLKLNETLSISVSLSGRYYEPNLPYPRFSTPSDYKPFKECRDFNGSRYDDPVKLCPSVAGDDWKVIKDNGFDLYIMAYNKKLRRAFTFDNVQFMKEKVCDARGRFSDIVYGVAAYDVDFDSSPEGCPAMDIKAGAFSRLSSIRPLSEYLRNFEGYYRCSAINFTGRRSV